MALILLPGPLAVNGDKQNIPLLQDSATPNRMSFDQGTPAVCSQDPNAGGLPPRRADMNQVHYMLTNNFYELQKGTLYTFDVFMTQAPNTGYPNGAVLWDYNTKQFLQSNKNNNTDNFVITPSFIGVSWIPVLAKTDLSNATPAALLNLGGMPFKTMPDNTDFNTLANPGFYRVASTASAPNAPTTAAASWWIEAAATQDPNWITQIARSPAVQNGFPFIRSLQNGVWGTWRLQSGQTAKTKILSIGDIGLYHGQIAIAHGLTTAQLVGLQWTFIATVVTAFNNWVPGDRIGTWAFRYAAGVYANAMGAINGAFFTVEVPANNTGNYATSDKSTGSNLATNSSYINLTVELTYFE